MSSVPESKNEPTRPHKSLFTAFWATASIFLLVIADTIIVSWVPIAAENSEYIRIYFLHPALAVFGLLGIALIFLALRSKILKGLRRGFIIVGASAVGMPVGLLLLKSAWAHNVLYPQNVLYAQTLASKLAYLLVPVLPVLFIISTAYCVFIIIATYCALAFKKAKGDISA